MATGSRQGKYVSTRKAGTRAFTPTAERLRLPLLLAVLLCLAGGASSAPAQAAGIDTPHVAGTCAAEVWRNAADSVWFYSETGERIVPEVNYAWLVVRFREDTAGAGGSGGEPPPAIAAFNTLFRERIVDFVYDPLLDPYLGMYRLGDPGNSRLLAAEMAEAEGVRYLRPAYTIGGVNFALLDEIGVHWKTLAGEEKKKALLAQVGALSVTEEAAGKSRIRLDPCRIAVWQAANLLAEDLQVVSAWPVLAKIEPPVRAALAVGINGATVGASIPFSLEIAFSPRVRIEPSTIANLNLRPRELARNLFKVAFDRPLSSVEAGTSPIRLQGELTLYGPGEFTLPEVPVYYREAQTEGREVKTIRTAAIPIRIASRIPETPGDYRLKVAEAAAVAEPEGANLRGSRGLALALAAGGAALLLACLAGIWRLAAFGAERLSTPDAEVGGKAEEIFRRSLAATGAGFAGAGLAVLGRAFRSWLGEICALPADALGGGAEVFFGRVRDCLPPESRADVYQLLELIEDGMAQGEVPGEAAGRLVELGRRIVLALEGAGTGKTT